MREIGRKRSIDERASHYRAHATARRTVGRRARSTRTGLRKGPRLLYMNYLSADVHYLQARWAHALFSSPLQPSQRPTPAQVRNAITVTLARHGVRGCACVMAEEFGAHPETAAPRMAWALATVRALHPVW
jgi:hypothetical protein